MKYVIGTIGTVVFLALAMAGWSVAGRFLTAKDDMSVAIGIIIIGTILGVLASGVAYLVSKAAKRASGPVSLDTNPFKKQQ